MLHSGECFFWYFMFVTSAVFNVKNTKNTRTHTHIVHQLILESWAKRAASLNRAGFPVTGQRAAVTKMETGASAKLQNISRIRRCLSDWCSPCIPTILDSSTFISLCQAPPSSDHHLISALNTLRRLPFAFRLFFFDFLGFPGWPIEFWRSWPWTR